MPSQSYSAGKFMLEIDGKAAGYLSSVEGGEPFAAVVAEPADAKGVVRKSPGPVAYEPIRISFGSGMEPPLYQWMADMLAGSQRAKSGAILFLNYSGNEQSRLEFTKGLITELTFPELDAGSKNPALFTLTLKPETTRVSKASSGGKGATAPTKKQKAWSSQDFRLKLDDLPTSKVSKIDAMTVKQAVIEKAGRLTLDPVDIPNIVFTLREADASEFSTWFQDFVVKGNSSDERSGTLEFLDAAAKDALFTLTLSNVGVIRIQRERNEQGSEVVARVRVSAYCEAMAFSSNADVTAATASADAPAADAVSTAGTALATALLDAVGRIERTGTSVLKLQSPGASSSRNVDPELIARRLQATVRSNSGGPAPSRFDDGALLGGRWATDSATLEELEQIAALESREWTAIRLESGHSLIAQLAKDGVVPAGEEGPLELDRDSFVEGIVAGASQVLRTAAPHLDGTSRQK